MSKTKAKNPLAIRSEFELLTPEQMKKMEELLPQWVRELADSGTAVLRWNQEFLILIEEILRRDHGFSEKQIKDVEGRVKEMLPHLHEMALQDLVLLRPHDMRVAMDIVEIHKKQVKGESPKLALPDLKTIKSLKK